MLAAPVTRPQIRCVVHAPITRPQPVPATVPAVIERFDSDFIDLVPTEWQDLLFVCHKYLPWFSDGTNVIKLLDSYRRHGSVWEVSVNDKYVGMTKFADQAISKAMQYLQDKGLVA